jgi:hypothetical protein
MKTLPCFLKLDGLFVLCLLAVASSAKISAQTAGAVPVVTVQATQPFATATSPGVFTVFRAGNTDATLNVWYDLAGTASNGVDYALIPPHLLAIDAGAVSNTIVIAPLTNPPASSVAKTVVLMLTNSPLMTPVNYEIGSPSRAVVYIEANGATNLPPSANLIEPADGTVFYTPTNIQMLAMASDPDGSVTNVEFFAGTNDLGPGTPVVLDPPGVNGVTGLVYLFNWFNPSPGDYPLTVVATDNGGASTLSPAVNIAVLQGPPTNLPPVVRIISPANGATFFAPINIPLYAFANDPAGSVESVEFFDGTNTLGFGQPVPVETPLASGEIVVGGPVPPIYPTNLYFLIWTNAPVGDHVLTAQATIVFTGHPLVLVAVSDPVKIAVLPSPPPPTNRPPIVSIVANDPVAIEDTNCWVWPGETNTPPTWKAWPAAVCRFFTNCGPKTATFTVRRFGGTNDDVTVPYDIGGTASNGVDYVALPGSVTVPAGERRAMITIVPIDDGPPDVNKTVILTLTPSTNTPPDYLVGFPPRAAAVIIDSAGPRPVAGMLPGNCFHLVKSGPDAAWFCVEYSTDMIHWLPVCTNQVINGSIDFVDPDANGNPARFYRTVPLTGPPAD